MGFPYAAKRMAGEGTSNDNLLIMKTSSSQWPHRVITSGDVNVERARRKESVRQALKLFRLTLDAVRRHAEWAESRHGIDSAQLSALWELAQNPGMRAADLAKAMAVHRATSLAMLDNLAAQDLAYQHDNHGTQVFSLTAAGQRIVEDVPEYSQGVLQAALRELPDDTLAQLVRSLGTVTEHLPFREQATSMQPNARQLRPSQHPPGNGPREINNAL